MQVTENDESCLDNLKIVWVEIIYILMINLRVNDGKGAVILVGDHLDEEFLASLQLAGVSQALVSDLIQSL